MVTKSETKIYLEHISDLFSRSIRMDEIEKLSLIESNVQYLTFCFTNNDIEFIDYLLEKYKE